MTHLETTQLLVSLITHTTIVIPAMFPGQLQMSVHVARQSELCRWIP